MTTPLPLVATPRNSIGTTVFLILGIMGLAAAFLSPEAGREGFLATSIFPFLAALACWLSGDRLFRAELTETALVVHDPEPSEVPFCSMSAVQCEGSGKRHPVHIVHANGVVSIPGHVDPPASQLVPLLGSRLPDLSSRLSEDLFPIHQRHVATFGPDRVFAFPARQTKVKGFRGRRGLALAGASLVSGVIWIALGVVNVEKNKDPAWLVGLGFVFVFVGFLTLVISLARRDLYGGKQSSRSGLVISPVGIALIQGDLRGEMQWSELVKMQYRDRSRPTRIHLTMPGASVIIRDLYSHPLAQIHAVMEKYWK
jgi:hypothetical protein